MSADLTRARTGGLDSAGPSSPAVRLPEEDDLFGLGMTGFVPSEPAGSAAAGPAAAQPLDAAMRGLAVSQASPTLQRDPRDGGGHGFGAGDSRRPGSAGLAAADHTASPVKCAPKRGTLRSVCGTIADRACGLDAAEMVHRPVWVLHFTGPVRSPAACSRGRSATAGRCPSGSPLGEGRRQ